MMLESTFCLIMLNLWEKVLVSTYRRGIHARLHRIQTEQRLVLRPSPSRSIMASSPRLYPNNLPPLHNPTPAPPTHTHLPHPTVSIVILFLTLIYISITNYLPSHLFFLRNRFAYYVYGDESAPIFSDWLAWFAGLGTGAAEGAGQAGKEVVGSGGAVGVAGTVTRVVVTGRPEL